MAEAGDNPDTLTRPGTGGLPPEPGKGATQDEIVADIEQTREQLRDTVDSLGEKLDVKGHAKARVAKVRDDAKTKVSDLTGGARGTYGRVLESDPVVKGAREPDGACRGGRRPGGRHRRPRRVAAPTMRTMRTTTNPRTRCASWPSQGVTS